jgi:hypothetical protein
MFVKIICTIISAAFAAAVYGWGHIIDHQHGGETWAFRAFVSLVMLGAGSYLIWRGRGDE